MENTVKEVQKLWSVRITNSVDLIIKTYWDTPNWKYIVLHHTPKAGKALVWKQHLPVTKLAPCLNEAAV